jgi:hypothetical protein
MTLWIEVPIIVLAVFVIFITVTSLVGEYRRRLEKAETVKRLASKSSTKSMLKVDYASLQNLPKPVQNYFRYALTDSLPFIRTTRLEQVGKLKVTPRSRNWSTFRSTQIISEDPVSFIWDAKIKFAPLFHIRVRDSFIDAIGEGNVYLMSAISVSSDRDKPELNSGALYRYLAEAVWHPTALLPQSGVVWESLDENRAIAHFKKFDITVSLEFRFNRSGEITGIYTNDRYGKFGDKYIKYPWEGKFSEYREFNGIKIPTRGEVGWYLPEGWWLFWQGKIVDAEFELAN